MPTNLLRTVPAAGAGEVAGCRLDELDPGEAFSEQVRDGQRRVVDERPDSLYRRCDGHGAPLTRCGPEGTGVRCSGPFACDETVEPERTYSRGDTPTLRRKRFSAD